MGFDFGEYYSRFYNAKELYSLAHTYFKEFCDSAEQYTEADPAIQGISAKCENEYLSLTFLDRCARVYLRCDFKAATPILYIEDHSAAPKDSRLIAKIPFDRNGETSISGGTVGGKISLGEEVDRKALLVHIVFLALAFDPWQPVKALDASPATE